MNETPVQYLIHPAMRPWLDAYLAQQGFRVDLAPKELQDEGDDALPIYLVTPTAERMART